MLTTPHNRDHQLAKLAVDINSASACRGAVRRKLLPSELSGFNLKKLSLKRSPIRTSTSAYSASAYRGVLRRKLL